MRNEFFEIRYCNTYYFANIVHNLLSDRFAYIRTISELFENDGHLSFIQPFPKQTALHQFIWFCVAMEFNEDLQSENFKRRVDRGDTQLFINSAFEFYDIEHTTFSEWQAGHSSLTGQSLEDQLCDYFVELRLEQAYEDLMKQISDEVFFIMFLNRTALELLNDLIAQYISVVTPDDLEEEDDRRLFAKDGVLKRVSIPEWVKKAVYHRDRGCCTYCHRDLSGLINISSEEHFDHIVPLAEGGINDVTNIQLLCAECNLRKGKKQTGASIKYERWYSNK
jgi:hypothetical protein